MSVEGSSVKGSIRQSSTSGPKIKGRGPLIAGGIGKRYYTGLPWVNAPGRRSRRVRLSKAHYYAGRVPLKQGKPE